ncbi:2Fe-2S iron-sulfur cluster-binding protein [Nocardia iowensis]|uniref:2Fe-2S iron-sulfur cluster binding domain-containing protein n=1 Tax=Nocardia iowensis TaxID=204891 RepID=A0ABX8RYZ4_NOCIO|nr:2Fe-2S iron-sulfur cluster binding domain-containing protein [Nocardia iowensis]QXN94899.1 2Fe-2S iron-sulfur cluster binding domain-containing protein [Nocardia iowensis]
MTRRAGGAPPPLVVELRRSGRTVLVPSALTVLEALEGEGVAIDSMCRAGICGTCETVALGAEPGVVTYPRAIRLCTVGPGVLTRLVLDL